MTHVEAPSFWSSHPLLQHTTENEQLALSEIGIRALVGPGSLVFQKGDPYRGPFVILKGTIKVYRTAHSGRQIVLYLMKEFGQALVAHVPLDTPKRQTRLPITRRLT